MDYDNARDRNLYGYDAGNIIDGEVVLDGATGEYVVVDDDGKAFSTQELLKSLAGKKVRLTCISFDAIEAIEKMVVKTEG
jgi:hypothetical protein